MKKLIKLFYGVFLITPAGLSVACNPGSDTAMTLTIYTDGANDAKALQKIGENFVNFYQLDGLKIKAQPVDMKNTANLMVSNPKMVKTDLYNMPHDYIGNLHSTKAMVNMNSLDLTADSVTDGTIGDLGITVADGKMTSPNGKVMATTWSTFLENIKTDWKNGGEIYGQPVNANSIDDIAIYEKEKSGNETVEVRYDYIYPSTFQTNMAEINTQRAEWLPDDLKGTDESGNYNFDVRDLIKGQVASKTNTDSQSHRLWNKELFFNDFKADFVTSAFLMELPKILKPGSDSEYYNKNEIKVINNKGIAFTDPSDSSASSSYIREQYEAHWKAWFTFLIDEYYSIDKRIPDYEANAKILKGEMGNGNLYLWNTATWDMSGATKEFKPNGSLVAGNGKVDLEFGRPVKWNKENESNPLLMVGGFGTYGRSTHKEISMAFMQYLARKEQSYTWMKQSRGMMYDKSSYESAKVDLDKIISENNTDTANSLLKDYFDPIDVDRPYIDTEYVQYWKQGMEQSMINADMATIIPSLPQWTSFLGEFSRTISALYSAAKTEKLADFKVDNYIKSWVKALDPTNRSGWTD